MEVSVQNLPGYAGEGMVYPYILRLVELDGTPAEVHLALPGQTLKALQTDLLGRALPEKPTVENIPAATHYAFGSRISLKLRPYEIATLYLDLELGRKVYRDLDAERGVWATVHKVDE